MRCNTHTPRETEQSLLGTETAWRNKEILGIHEFLSTHPHTTSHTIVNHMLALLWDLTSSLSARKNFLSLITSFFFFLFLSSLSVYVWVWMCLVLIVCVFCFLFFLPQFVKFANIEEDTPSYHRRYDFFVSQFSAMCHSTHEDPETRTRFVCVCVCMVYIVCIWFDMHGNTSPSIILRFSGSFYFQ